MQNETRTSTQAHAGASSGSTKPVCGAKTRKGTACQCKRLLRNGRCKLHGGASTGPRTAEGRARALANLRSYQATAKIEIENGDITLVVTDR